MAFSNSDTSRYISDSSEPIIKDELYLFIMSISLGIICQIVSVFGSINNVINISIFVRQGFTDTINISLLALAVSDMCSLLTIMWSNLCFTQAFQESGIPLLANEVQLISGSWPHVTFTRTTGWITAFISFERCMCVIFPLKVKTLFTPKRHTSTMIAIYVVTLGCSTLAYVSLGLEWRFYPQKNRTLIGLAYHMDAYRRKITDAVSYAVNGVLMPMTCFLSVVVCTAVLVVKLNQQTSWRQTNASAASQGQVLKTERVVNTKERRVATMVVFISAIFIASFVPAVCIFVAGYIEPQLSYDGRYKHLFLVTLSISFTVEAINSSINIFVYFSMSTKYRETFLQMFCLQKVSKNESTQKWIVTQICTRDANIPFTSSYRSPHLPSYLCFWNFQFLKKIKIRLSVNSNNSCMSSTRSSFSLHACWQRHWPTHSFLNVFVYFAGRDAFIYFNVYWGARMRERMCVFVCMRACAYVRKCAVCKLYKRMCACVCVWAFACVCVRKCAKLSAGFLRRGYNRN